MRPLHIALGSTTSLPGQVERNLGQLAQFARQAGWDGADLLLTPELSASGYGGYPEVVATAERAGEGPIYRALAKLAQETGVVIAAGFVEAPRYLAHYVVFPDGRFVVQRKHRTTNVEKPLEPCVEQLPPLGVDGTGQPRAVKFEFFEVKGIRCAVTICADSGITDLPVILDEARVELQLVPTAAGGCREDRVATADLLTETGREKYYQRLERVFFPGRSVLDCIVHRRAEAAVNLCGFDGRELAHLGHGTIINPMGEVPALIHGLPNLDRQRPMYTHAVVDFDEHV